MSQQQNYFEAQQQALKSTAKFTVLTKNITQSQRVKIEPGCYSFFAINMGDVLITVDQFPLLPRLAAGLYGGYFGFGDNRRFFGKTDVNCSFTAGGADPLLVITQIVQI